MACYNDEGPECPFCGHTETPDEDFYYRDSLKSLECGDCGKSYSVTVDHCTTWTSYAPESSQ